MLKIIKEDGLVAEHLVKNVRAYVDDGKRQTTRLG